MIEVRRVQGGPVGNIRVQILLSAEVGYTLSLVCAEHGSPTVTNGGSLRLSRARYELEFHSSTGPTGCFLSWPIFLASVVARSVRSATAVRGSSSRMLL